MRQPLCPPYRLCDVKRIWRGNHGLGRGSLQLYEYWVYRFARYCYAHSLDQRSGLTQLGAEQFARWWRSQGSRRRGDLKEAIRGSRMALRAWAFALSMLGESIPPWSPPRVAPMRDPRLGAFADYLREVRGNPPQTIHKKLAELTAFDHYRQRLSAAERPIRLSEIDTYVIACRRRFARKTVASICSTIRSYLRFLHATGAIDTDLATSVMAPIVRTAERPHRALPWADVQRILRAVDRTSPKGHDLIVAKSSGGCLKRFVGLQSELALTELYEGSGNYFDAIEYYRAQGFSLSALVPNNLGHFPRLYEMDCIMFNDRYFKE